MTSLRRAFAPSCSVPKLERRAVPWPSRTDSLTSCVFSRIQYLDTTGSGNCSSCASCCNSTTFCHPLFCQSLRGLASIPSAQSILYRRPLDPTAVTRWAKFRPVPHPTRGQRYPRTASNTATAFAPYFAGRANTTSKDGINRGERPRAGELRVNFRTKAARGSAPAGSG